VLRLLGLLALLLWLLHLLALELLRLLVWLLALGLLRLLLWLLGLLSAGELATLPACGRLFLVFGRPTRRTRGALLLAGLLLTAPSCLSFLSLLTELVLVALITHSLSPVAVCRFATDGSNEGARYRQARQRNAWRAPAIRIGPSIPVGATRVVVKVMASVQQVAESSLPPQHPVKTPVRVEGAGTNAAGRGPGRRVRSLPGGNDTGWHRLLPHSAIGADDESLSPDVVRGHPSRAAGQKPGSS